MSDGGARPEHKESCTRCSFHVPEPSENLSSCHQFNPNPIVLHVDVVGRVDDVATAMFCFCIVHSVRLWWHVYREASVGANLVKCGRSELVSLETSAANFHQ